MTTRRPRILAMSGSLRSDSSNGRLVRAAAALAAPALDVVVWDGLAALPWFSPDLDAEGSTPPGPVAELRGALARAEGVLLSCPEYAHGVPGAFKNALDWIVSSGELGRKPTALLAASPSGAAHARAALLPTLEALDAELVFEASRSVIRGHFDAEGRLTDPELIAVVERSVAALAAAIVRHRGDGT
jgi:NAD(P)H-dependent FMN reductase